MCRRVGERLCTSDKCPVVRRPYPPGAHGTKKQRRKLSTYGVQFREKQKAKIIYGLLERQFRNTYELAKRRAGNTATAFVELLESRLDNVVFRLGFAKTRDQARQLVSHGHITVSGKRVTIPSYRVRAGEVIGIYPTSAARKYFTNDAFVAAMAKYSPPSWLTLDATARTGRVLGRPELDEAKQNFDPKLIVEFYSR